MKVVTLQIRVLWALILRETKTRYGKTWLHYPLVVIEPLLHVAAFTYGYTLLDRHAPMGESLFLYLLTGILPFFLFRDLINNVMNAVSSNRALLAYPLVKPVDVILARISLELLTYGVIALALIPVCIMLELQFMPDRIGVFIVGVALLALLGAGMGLIVASLSLVLPFIAKMMAWILRLLYLMSGALFSLRALPSDYQWLFIYNPLAQSLDLIRAGFYFGVESQIVDIPMLLSLIVFLFFTGFSLEFLLRSEMKRA
jgi:capsular polysaccharide transport system permease protein